MHNEAATICVSAVAVSSGHTFKSNTICVLLEIYITRQMAVNQILCSIALEGIALSHIINAEGEKMQYVLGTLTKEDKPNATIEQVISVNKSVNDTLRTTLQYEAILKSKLSNILFADKYNKL